MAIPFKYNLRNLFRRKLRSLLTIAGIALVITSVVVMLAFIRGLVSSTRNNGDSDNIALISKKASDRIFSSIKKSDFEVMRGELAEDIAMKLDGDFDIEIAAAHINHTVSVNGGGEAIIIGVDPASSHFLYHNFKLEKGKHLWQALDEEINNGRVALAGPRTFIRLGLKPEEVKVGTMIEFNGVKWQIVGLFSAPGTNLETEIWVPRDELATIIHRTDLSFGTIKIKDEKRMPKVLAKIAEKEKLPFTAMPEKKFFAGFAETFNVFIYIALVMAGMITIGGILAGMNTMYTAVQGRIREFGTLQVLGFSKSSIMLALLMESLLLSLIGGSIGCAIGLVINGLPMQVTMGAILFQVDWIVITVAMGMASFIGLVGVLVPARRAMSLSMVEAMRFN